MLGLRRISVGFALAACVLLFVAAAPRPSLAAGDGDSLRSEVAREIAEAGASPAVLLNAPVTLFVPDEAGVPRALTLPAGEFLDAFSLPAPAAEAGGAPEVVAGNVRHFYVNLAFGDARAYRVNASSIAPAFPAAPTLTTGDTVLLYDAPGAVKTVRGAYSYGYHSVGGHSGSNVAASPDGVAAPLLLAGTSTDASIDFRGRAVVSEAVTCSGRLCLALGTLAGLGVATFDAAPLDVPPLP